MFRLIPVMDQTHLNFQRGQEAWLAEFEKRWGRNNEAAKAQENPKPERVFSERSEETLSCPPQALKFLR